MKNSIIFGIVIICIFIVGVFAYFYEDSRLRNIINSSIVKNIEIIDSNVKGERDKYLNERSVLAYGYIESIKDRDTYQQKYEELKNRLIVHQKEVIKEVPKTDNELINAFNKLGYKTSIMDCK